MSEQPPLRPRIPIGLLIVDAIGIVLAGLGIAGLVTDVSGLFPFLADKQVAGIVAGIGFALVTFALGTLFRWQKMLRAAREQAAARPD
jgi:uncharacterized membrane protein YidH (DUF202 family)